MRIEWFFISPSPKDTSCEFWLKLAQWFWRRRFLNFAIWLLSPLGKGRGPSFQQTGIPFTQKSIVPRLVEIVPLVQEMNIFFKISSMYFRYLVIICP